MTSRLVFLHFNDCYHIGEREKEPCGGAARFAGLLRQHDHEDPVILFSGDIFAPSLTSTIVRGEQMVPCLNNFGIAASCFGNHDLDFGVQRLVHLKNACNFPWLCSNVVDAMTGGPLAEGIVTHILEKNGKKIGLMGLVEEDWLVTLATLEDGQAIYTDFVARGHELAAQLKDQGADIIIALTHMREHNDIRLAQECPEIDMILGGHDHFYNVQKVGGTLVAKSGCDFRDLSRIEVEFGPPGTRPRVIDPVQHLTVTRAVPADPATLAVVKEFERLVGKKMDQVIGQVDVPLEARVEHLRTGEVNLGNFITDIIREAMKADCCILNSGTIRGNDVFGPGPFRMRDLTTILPMEDMVVVIALHGRDIRAALENGVSKYPAHEGRFPQVSGIEFVWDPRKPPGHRVLTIKINGEMMDEDKEYTLATKDYLTTGKDGYTSFLNSRSVIGVDSGAMLPTLVRNHFTVLSVASGFRAPERGTPRALKRVTALAHRVRARNDTESSPTAAGAADGGRGAAAASSPQGKPPRTPTQRGAGTTTMLTVAPEVEGRIRNMLQPQGEGLNARRWSSAEAQECVKQLDMTLG